MDNASKQMAPRMPSLPKNKFAGMKITKTKSIALPEAHSPPEPSASLSSYANSVDDKTRNAERDTVRLRLT